MITVPIENYRVVVIVIYLILVYNVKNTVLETELNFIKIIQQFNTYEAMDFFVLH